jgi:imidazolonepropionase-like amidohydrolase
MKKAIVGGTIIDCTGAAPIADGILLIDGEKIAAVGSKGDVTIPRDAEVIDATGQTVMPGMINTHEHLAQPDPDDPLITNYPAEKNTGKASAQYLHTFAVRYGRQELKDGVTTVRVLGEKDGIDFGYKEAFDRGLVPGPRVIPSGTALATAISHGDIISTIVNGPDEARAAVRANIAAGSKVIKLFISGGRTLGVPHHLTTCFFTREELQAAIDEAHKFDVKVTAHLNGGIGVNWAIEAGMDSIEHASELSDKELELVAKSGTWVCLTLLWAFAKLTYYQQQGSKIFDTVARRANRLRDAGVKLSLGNDGCHQDHGMARQVDLLTQFGFPAMEAILMATRGGAEICGIADQRGTLKAGLDADVILVGGDPLKDIKALRDVRTVIKGGTVYCGL